MDGCGKEPEKINPWPEPPERNEMTEEVKPDNTKEPEYIDQVIMPSYHTKLVCTSCGREDWHTLILRRYRGLIQGLCKQKDGSGCYPNSSQVLCRWNDPEQIPCRQLAQYEILDPNGRKITEACADHVGLMIPKGLNTGYTIFPLED